jgi:hypothetical protein
MQYERPIAGLSAKIHGAVEISVHQAYEFTQVPTFLPIILPVEVRKTFVGSLGQLLAEMKTMHSINTTLGFRKRPIVGVLTDLNLWCFAMIQETIIPGVFDVKHTHLYAHVWKGARRMEFCEDLRKILNILKSLMVFLRDANATTQAEEVLTDWNRWSSEKLIEFIKKRKPISEDAQKKLLENGIDGDMVLTEQVDVPFLKECGIVPGQAINIVKALNQLPKLL